MPAKIKIAIADDHIAMLATIRMFLADHKDLDICLEARSLTDFLNQMRTASYLPDVCLLDIHMPPEGWLMDLPDIVREWPTVKFIILSAYLTEQNVVRSLNAGAHAVVTKESDLIDIDVAIRQIVTQGYYDSPSFSKKLQQQARRKSLYAPQLTEQERLFLQYCCMDLTYHEIADKMGVGLRTAQSYASRLCEKLKVNGREGLIAYVYRSGFFPEPPEE